MESTAALAIARKQTATAFFGQSPAAAAGSGAVTLEAKRRHSTPFLRLLGHEAGGGAVSGLGRARPLRPPAGSPGNAADAA